ncbi:MAG: hypothetical protein GX640_19515 [Fibrobacter sp.]|nr:hypothetical protein [Fibrobacter sp.]
MVRKFPGRGAALGSQLNSNRKKFSLIGSFLITVDKLCFMGIGSKFVDMLDFVAGKNKSGENHNLIASMKNKWNIKLNSAVGFHLLNSGY